MRYSVAIAAIPVAVWAAWPAPPQELTVRAVATEGVRAQRQDDNTFVLRWSAITLLPPATEVRYVQVADTMPGRKSQGRVDTPRHRLRSRPARLDVCQRHNMRKVMVGKYRWRCRR